MMGLRAGRATSRWIGAILTALFVIAAGAAMAQGAPVRPDPTTAGVSIADEYLLQANDQLKITVFGEQDLSGEFRIDANGLVSLPLVGEKRAAGQTLRAFQRSYEAELRQGGYLIDPRVTAEVLNFRPFYVLGEVGTPGEFPYTAGLTVLSAIAQAGGFKENADRESVTIKRFGSDRDETVRVQAGLAINPGDTIRVDKSTFYILGEVEEPGEYPIAEGLSALNAIALAGGFTVRAAKGTVYIRRAGENREETFRLTNDLLLRKGDSLRIGERFF